MPSKHRVGRPTGAAKAGQAPRSDVPDAPLEAIARSDNNPDVPLEAIADIDMLAGGESAADVTASNDNGAEASADNTDKDDDGPTSKRSKQTTNSASKKRKNNEKNTKDKEDDDGGSAPTQMPDPPVEDDIKGRDGEYPLLPRGHQAEYFSSGHGIDHTEVCYGGRRYINTSTQWQRLIIPAQEMAWKSIYSKMLRVIPNHLPNVTRHLHHTGPHLSMTFDITEQNTPDAGDDTMKILIFLVYMVNVSQDLRGSILKTHYTTLDINQKKVRGVFWNGGKTPGKEGTGDFAGDHVAQKAAEEADNTARTNTKQDDDSDDEEDTLREINPISLFIKIIPVTYNLHKEDGLVVQRQSLFACATAHAAPGVDIMRAIESVCSECPCSIVRDERQMLFARLRMHDVEPSETKAGERHRRMPVETANVFLRQSQEIETAGKIKRMLEKKLKTSKTKISELEIVGLAVPEGNVEVKHHERATTYNIKQCIKWREKFTTATDKHRQDVANTFPFIPRMPQWIQNDTDGISENTNGERTGCIEGVITMELYQPLDFPPFMKWSEFQVGGFPESVTVTTHPPTHPPTPVIGFISLPHS
jgi:hypothetical protein